MVDPLHIHLLKAFDPEPMAELRRRLDARIVLTAGDDERPSPPTYRMLIGGRPEESDLDDCAALDTFIVPFAGIPAKTRDRLLARPHIAVHNLHHNAPPTAEMAVALMLAAAKAVVPHDRNFREHNWTRLDPPGSPVLLDGATVLILGLGAIGDRVGRACKAMGMRVIATRRRLEEVVYADPADQSPQAAGAPLAFDELHPGSALRELLPRANVVMVCLPLTDDTKGLLGESELALLPPRAVLVNVGRGPIVDEGALYGALKSRRLYGAGIDVWYQYPENRIENGVGEPSAHPFHELDNVVMSPHRGGWSDDSEMLRAVALADALNEVAQGRPLPHKVDLHAGY